MRGIRVSLAFATPCGKHCLLCFASVTRGAGRQRQRKAKLFTWLCWRGFVGQKHLIGKTLLVKTPVKTVNEQYNLRQVALSAATPMPNKSGMRLLRS